MAFYTLAICTKIPKPQHSIPSTNRFIYFVVFFSSVFFLFASANIAPIASNMHFTWLPGIVASMPFRFHFFPPNSIDESNQIWYITAHTHFEIDSKPMEKHCMNMRADEMKHQRLSIHSKQVNAHRTHSHQPALAHFGTEADKPASKKIYHLIALYHWIWYWMMLMLLMMTVNVYHRSTVSGSAWVFVFILLTLGPPLSFYLFLRSRVWMCECVCFWPLRIPRMWCAWMFTIFFLHQSHRQ